MKVPDIEELDKRPPCTSPMMDPSGLADHVAARLARPHAVAFDFVRGHPLWDAAMVHEPGNGLFASPSERVNARVDHEAARAQQGAPDKADPSHRIILIRSQLVRELDRKSTRLNSSH